MPRAASSWGRSSFLSLLKLSPCVSQVALALGAHEMQATRVPASMSLRQERALAVNVAAIGIAQAGMLAVELERAPGLGGGEQIERTGLEAVHLLEPPVARERVGRVPHAGEQPLAIAEPSRPDPVGEPKLRHPEIRRARVVEYEQGVEISAEPAAEETRLRRTAGPFGRDVWHRNIWRNHRAGDGKGPRPNRSPGSRSVPCRSPPSCRRDHDRSGRRRQPLRVHCSRCGGPTGSRLRGA